MCGSELELILFSKQIGWVKTTYVWYHHQPVASRCKIGKHWNSTSTHRIHALINGIFTQIYQTKHQINIDLNIPSMEPIWDIHSQLSKSHVFSIYIFWWLIFIGSFPPWLPWNTHLTICTLGFDGLLAARVSIAWVLYNWILVPEPRGLKKVLIMAKLLSLRLMEEILHQLIW